MSAPPVPALADPLEPAPSLAHGCAFACAAVAVALALGLAVERAVSVDAPVGTTVLFSSAIVISAARGGFYAGLCATALAALALGLFELRPLYSLRVSAVGDAMLLILFLAEGAALSAAGAAFGRGPVARSRAQRYAAAMGTVGAAVLVKVLFGDGLPRAVPFMLFYAAVAFAAWFGGIGPALLATGTAAASAAFLFFEPRYEFRVASPERAAQLVAFVAEGGLIAVCGQVAEVLRARAAASARAARAYWGELRATEERLRRQNAALAELARRDDAGALPDALAALTEVAARTAQVARASVWLFDPTRTVLRCEDLYEPAAGAHSRGAELAAAPFPAYLSAVATGRSLAAHDARTDARTAELLAHLEPLGVTSMLDAPVRVGGAVAGVVCLEHVGPPRRWAADEEQFAGSVADLVALAVKRAELRDATDRLRRAQQLESVGALASGVAHDLNNLLTPVLAGADLLRDTVPPESTPLLDVMRGSAERGAALLRQLLGFARGTAGASGPTALALAVEQVAPVLRIALGKSVELITDADPNAPKVALAGIQIDQLLLNLCTNARDAMPGGGTVRVTARARDLAPGAPELPAGARPGTYVALAVADTGTGIAPDVLERVFEPLFTTKPAGKGTGLGLSTCRDIATAAGGFVTVQSEVGRGTTFAVFLPAVGPGAPAKPDSGEVPLGRGELVLVADYDASVRAFACGILEAFGYATASAATADELAARCAAPGPNLRAVVLDADLPGADPAAVPCGLVLAVPLGRAAPPNAVPVTKPYDRNALLRAVRRAIDAPPTGS